ncbi:MAG: ATP-binding protein [Candidatus Hodarchaeales archaeon]|jgi:signal transduction histidine kinase
MNQNTIKILIIEDNPGDARLIQEMLKSNHKKSFMVEWADELSSGLKFLSEKNFNVILLDLNLSDSQGWETFEKAYQSAPKIPFIVMTGLDDEDLAVKAVIEGAQDYLVKGSVDGDSLKRSIQYAIERKKLMENQKELEKKLIKQNQDLEILVQEQVQQLIHQERAALIGRLAGSIAHDINNPLGFVMANAEILELNLQSAENIKFEWQKSIKGIISGCERIEETTKRLRQASATGTVSIFNLIDTLKSAITITKIKWSTVCKSIPLNVEEDIDAINIKGNENDLSHVFMNIIVNASQAIEKSGIISININLSRDKRNVIIEIKDNGCGIPQEVLNKIGKEIVTTKSIEEGTGLGLITAYDIIKNLKGKISIQTNQSKGTRFRIELPVNKNQ